MPFLGVAAGTTSTHLAVDNPAHSADGSWAAIRGGQGTASQSGTREAARRKRAQARRLGAPTWAALGWGRGQARSAMRATGIQNLGLGARALSEYACDANAIWKTMHASVEQWRVATVPIAILVVILNIAIQPIARYGLERYMREEGSKWGMRATDSYSLLATVKITS
eukprot:6194819-Pleurochrysis_carterae.AAC.1